MTLLRPSFALLSLALVAVLLVPNGARAANDLQITIKQMNALPGTALLYKPATMPFLTVGEAIGSYRITLAYHGLPAGSALVVVDARGENMVSSWSLGAGPVDNSFVVALPSTLPRGEYALRALDIATKNVHAESASFRVDRSGKISMIGQGNQTAQFRMFVASSSFTQVLGITKEKARRLCESTKREREREAVLCVWNDKRF